MIEKASEDLRDPSVQDEIKRKLEELISGATIESIDPSEEISVDVTFDVSTEDSNVDPTSAENEANNLLNDDGFATETSSKSVFVIFIESFSLLRNFCNSSSEHITCAN